MPHPAMTIAMVAALIAAIIAYRELLIAVVAAYGLIPAIAAIAVCYALACIIHRRRGERGGY